jgi:hypothetical protein
LKRAAVDAVELAHAEREVRVRRLDHEVEVVAHQAVRVTDPAVAVDDLREPREQPPAVAVVAEDRRALVPARVNVVEGVLELDPKRACHAATVSSRAGRGKMSVTGASRRDMSKREEARPDPRA